VADTRDPWKDRRPSFLAKVPWIGPILGESVSLNGRTLVRLGAGADPLLGKALAMLLVPVRLDEQQERFAWSHSGWLARARNDKNGIFRIEAPASFWGPDIAGVLAILLYDQSADPWAQFYADALAAEFARHGPGPWDRADSEPIPVASLPESMKREVERELKTLLERSSRELMEALVRVEGRDTRSPRDPLALTFAVASCQYPAGFFDRDVAERSYERLARCLDRKDAAWRPECVLLVGDQIYADATAGLFDPTTLYDRFELPYERLLRIAPLRRIQRRVPTYTMLDDHEIEDNWEPVAGESRRGQALVDGCSSYLRYQRMAGPNQSPPGCLWYPFEVGGFPFFMADTRTERSPRTAQTVKDACIMDDDQLKRLQEWLVDPAKQNLPKFIASPTSFLPRHHRAAQNEHLASAIRSDGWDGYPKSFFGLLDYIATKRIRHVVFLSGDEHISFATTAVISANGSGEVTRFHSIHSSALYAPFPFANSIYDNLAYDERFRFGDYQCQVSIKFAAPGDGFALLRAYRDGKGRWMLRCRFMRGPRPATAEKTIDLEL